jgi:hypothetical protein
VPASLRSFIYNELPGAGIDAIDVYGPGTRAALVKASMGDIRHSSVRDIGHKWEGKGFYLVVFHGQFYCGGCGGRDSRQTPQASVWVWVWSPSSGGTDVAIMKNPPPGVTKLHQLAKVAVA